MMQGTRNSLWYPDVFLWHSSCCILPYRSLLWSMVECSLAHGGVWSRWHEEFFGAALSGATEVLNQGCYPQMRPFLHVKWNNRVHQLFPLWFFSYTYILSFSECIKDILDSWNLIAVLSSGLTKNHFMNSTFSCLQWSFSSGLPLKSLWKFHWHSHNLQWYSPFHASVSWQWCPYDSLMDWVYWLHHPTPLLFHTHGLNVVDRNKIIVCPNPKYLCQSFQVHLKLNRLLLTMKLKLHSSADIHTSGVPKASPDCQT